VNAFRLGFAQLCLCVGLAFAARAQSNAVSNGSFELGYVDWRHFSRLCTGSEFSVVSKDAVDGNRCAQLRHPASPPQAWTALASRWFGLKPGVPRTLALWLRSSNASQYVYVELSRFDPATSRLRSVCSSAVRVGREWGRHALAVPAELNAQTPYRVHVWVDRPGTVWVDGVTLMEKTAAKTPSGPRIEFGLRMNRTDLIYDQSDNVYASVVARSNDGSKTSAFVKFRLSDCREQEVLSGSFEMHLGGNAPIERHIDVTPKSSGYYRMSVQLQDEHGKTLAQRRAGFCFLDANRDRKLDLSSPFGVRCIGADGGKALTRAFVLGAKWIRLEECFTWQPSAAGGFALSWPTQALARCAKLGVAPLLVSSSFPIGFEPREIEGQRRNQAWETLIGRLLRRHRATVHAWEPVHAPGAWNTPDPLHTIDYIRPTYEAARFLAPTCTVAAIPLDYREIGDARRLLSVGAAAYTDCFIANVDILDAAPEQLGVGRKLRRLDDLTKRFGERPLWVTALSCPCRDDSAGLWRPAAEGVSPLDQARFLTRATVLALANGAERVFWPPALGHLPNGRPLADALAEADCQSSPRPAFAAYRTLIKYLRGRAFHSELKFPDPYVRAFTFFGGNTEVCVLWSIKGRRAVAVVMPAGRERRIDLMDNALPFPVSEIEHCVAAVDETPRLIVRKSEEPSLEPISLVNVALAAPRFVRQLQTVQIEASVINPFSVALQGVLRAAVPNGWACESKGIQIALRPGETGKHSFTVKPSDKARTGLARIGARFDIGSGGIAPLYALRSVRVCTEGSWNVRIAYPQKEISCVGPDLKGWSIAGAEGVVASQEESASAPRAVVWRYNSPRWHRAWIAARLNFDKAQDWSAFGGLRLTCRASLPRDFDGIEVRIRDKEGRVFAGRASLSKDLSWRTPSVSFEDLLPVERLSGDVADGLNWGEIVGLTFRVSCGRGEGWIALRKLELIAEPPTEP